MAYSSAASLAAEAEVRDLFVLFHSYFLCWHFLLAPPARFQSALQMVDHFPRLQIVYLMLKIDLSQGLVHCLQYLPLELGSESLWYTLPAQ